METVRLEIAQDLGRQSCENASHEEKQQLTADELRDLSNNPELSDSCYRYMHNM